MTPRRVFVTGGTGFIGAALVRQLVGDGHRVAVLARSDGSAEIVRALGGEPVHGDLYMAGPWQKRLVESEWVVHLAQPLTYGGKVTRRRAEAYRMRRQVMDRHVLQPLGPSVERVVYVGGTSYYGNLGTELCDEDTPPTPRGWGPYVAPAIDDLARHLARGVPIVTAFPGFVYGDGSWFREYVIRPLRAQKKIYVLLGRPRWCSPIHLDDCARALGHLCAAGEPGRRYFLVDDRPIKMSDIHRQAAAALGVPLRTRPVPTLLARWLLGPVVSESIQSDAVLSNRRLKETGFALRFPTVEEGIPDVIARCR